MADTRAEFLSRLDRLQAGLGQAFAEAVQDIRSTAQLDALEAAIGRGDIQGAFDALRLGPEFWAPLDQRIEDAFRQGALWQMASTMQTRGARQAGVVVRFDGRHPRAEAWSRNRAGRLITEITQDTRLGVREMITAGLEANDHPRTVARRIVGTREGNQRKGGLVGLHSRQMGYVANARAELGDPDRMSDYFTRKLRDRRFDSVVRRAMNEGRALSKADIDRIARRYSDRLLIQRGQTIARTEALTALSAGRNEAIYQMIDRGDIPPDAVTLVWQSTVGSMRTRDTHRAMHGQEVRFGQAFTSPSGARLMFPGDTSLGAGAEETINCRCSVRPRVDWVMLSR